MFDNLIKNEQKSYLELEIPNEINFHEFFIKLKFIGDNFLELFELPTELNKM